MIMGMSRIEELLKQIQDAELKSASIKQEAKSRASDIKSDAESAVRKLEKESASEIKQALRSAGAGDAVAVETLPPVSDKAIDNAVDFVMKEFSKRYMV